MKGQMTFIKKPPVWHVSLTHVWVECPTCKSYNTAQGWEWQGYGKEREKVPVNLPECPECKQPFDWSEAAVEKATVYAKNYPRRKS